MGSARVGTVSPFHTPPPGSELHRLDAELRRLAAGGTPETVARSLWEHRRALFARHVVRRLESLGLSPDPREPLPAWGEALVEHMLDHAERAFGEALMRVVRLLLTPPARVGRPGPALVPAAIGMSEFRSQAEAHPERRLKAHYRNVAAALGPGIEDHHVRRLVERPRDARLDALVGVDGDAWQAMLDHLADDAHAQFRQTIEELRDARPVPGRRTNIGLEKRSLSALRRA